MRFIAPVDGTAESSLLPAASLPKSTSAKNGLTSPVFSALPCCWSRHHAGSVVVEVPLRVLAYGSFVRKATLKRVGGWETPPPPPGCVGVALPVGTRYLLFCVSHSPTPAAR